MLHELVSYKPYLKQFQLSNQFFCGLCVGVLSWCTNLFEQRSANSEGATALSFLHLQRCSKNHKFQTFYLSGSSVTFTQADTAILNIYKEPV